MTPKTTFIQMDDNASIEEKVEALLRAEGEVTVKGIKMTLEISADDALAVLEKFVSEGKAEKGIKYMVPGVVYSSRLEEYYSNKVMAFEIMCNLEKNPDGLTFSEINRRFDYMREEPCVCQDEIWDLACVVLKSMLDSGQIYLTPAGVYKKV